MKLLERMNAVGRRPHLSPRTIQRRRSGPARTVYSNPSYENAFTFVVRSSGKWPDGGGAAGAGSEPGGFGYMPGDGGVGWGCGGSTSYGGVFADRGGVWGRFAGVVFLGAQKRPFGVAAEAV